MTKNHRRGGGNSKIRDSTLRFAELSGVLSLIETYPLDKAAEVYAHER